VQITSVSSRKSFGPSIRLAQGATRLVHVDEGCTLVVVRGVLRLNDAQRWLAEHAWTPAIDLAEGEAHVCGGAGWFRIDASSDCEAVFSPSSAPDAAASMVERIIRRWHAAFGHAAFS
jgi:hypothetical protein